ncbi:MAG: 6-phosphofructokinase [Ruminococcaceae bacterium]|nr:6-phosphofructokinase [Oscillospiraceae bacterium]
MLQGNAIVGQSGGPTAAINATLSGVIRGVLSQSGQNGAIQCLYGMRNGLEGLLERRTVCLSELLATEDSLRLLEQTPAAALGSCRKKLPAPDSGKPEDQAIYTKLFDILREMNIRYFFYIGGNDSMDTVEKMSRYAERVGYEIRIVGVPKTIDNDLPETDHTPGYGSAAKYVATVTREIIRDCAVYTTKAVTIVEIMGRGAGWLAAASAAGQAVGGEAPDLVYLPERTFDMERFFASIEKKFAEKPNLVVAVSEGLRFADGRYVSKVTGSSEADAFGHQYLAGTAKALEVAVKWHFGCKVRSIELNLPQRCGGHILSLADRKESVAIGKAAVEAALAGVSGEMMVFERLSDQPYSYRIGHRDVSRIANGIRSVPDEYINEGGDGITDACCAYILPLIAGECDILWKDGMPEHLIL